jgi:hypothetical protein
LRKIYREDYFNAALHAEFVGDHKERQALVVEFCAIVGTFSDSTMAMIPTLPGGDRFLSAYEEANALVEIVAGMVQKTPKKQAESYALFKESRLDDTWQYIGALLLKEVGTQQRQRLNHLASQMTIKEW